MWTRLLIWFSYPCPNELCFDCYDFIKMINPCSCGKNVYPPQIWRTLFRRWFIYCPNCGSISSRTEYMVEAINAWNKQQKKNKL